MPTYTRRHTHHATHVSVLTPPTLICPHTSHQPPPWLVHKLPSSSETTLRSHKVMNHFAKATAEGAPHWEGGKGKSWHPC